MAPLRVRAACAVAGHRPQPTEAPEGTMWVAPLRAGDQLATPAPAERAHEKPLCVPLRVLDVCARCGAWRIPGISARGTWVRSRTG